MQNHKSRQDNTCRLLVVPPVWSCTKCSILICGRFEPLTGAKITTLKYDWDKCKDEDELTGGDVSIFLGLHPGCVRARGSGVRCRAPPKFGIPVRGFFDGVQGVFSLTLSILLALCIVLSLHFFPIAGHGYVRIQRNARLPPPPLDDMLISSDTNW